MVKKPTPSSPSFPWEQLKAESMRSICRDLGLKVSHNRSVMTHFLESVSKVGCESPHSLFTAASTSLEGLRATGYGGLFFFSNPKNNNFLLMRFQQCPERSP